MVLPSTCSQAFTGEDALLEAAANVWAVLHYAGDLPATPDSRARLAEGLERLDALLAATGISETEIRAYLRRRRSDPGEVDLLGAGRREPSDLTVLDGGARE